MQEIILDSIKEHVAFLHEMGYVVTKLTLSARFFEGTALDLPQELEGIRVALSNYVDKFEIRIKPLDI